LFLFSPQFLLQAGWECRFHLINIERRAWPAAKPVVSIIKVPERDIESFLDKARYTFQVLLAEGFRSMPAVDQFDQGHLGLLPVEIPRDRPGAGDRFPLVDPGNGLLEMVLQQGTRQHLCQFMVVTGAEGRIKIDNALIRIKVDVILPPDEVTLIQISGVGARILEKG